MLVINLDTNHVSDLIRRPGDSDVAAILRLLERGEVQLGLSLFHIVELSAPTFAGYDQLLAILREIPVTLLNPREDIFEEEAASAVARSTGKLRRPPRVFARDLSEWGYSPGPPGYGATDMLEYYRERPNEREPLQELGRRNAHLSTLKERAAVVQDPELPLRLLLDDHLAKLRQTNPGYGDGLAPEAVLRRVGGITAFPAYRVSQELALRRLRHPQLRTEPNDLVDEYIASYAPYVAATALDRRTAHRAREANLARVTRITRKLADVPAIVANVLAGQDAPEASA